MRESELPSNWTRRHLMALTALMATSAISASAEDASKAAMAAKESSRSGTRGFTPIDVAVVLGAYNTLIDFAGPWEVLSSSCRFNLYSVASTREPVICDDARSLDARRPISGLTVMPDFAFDNAPQPRIIIVGGQDEGKATQRQTRKLEWIRHAAQGADLTASVCVGAFEVGKAGLFDGHSATTNRNAYDEFERTFPRVKLIRGVRFVESGRVASATGLTAGIDLALRITERFCGHALAQKIATYEEWASTGWALPGQQREGPRL